MRTLGLYPVPINILSITCFFPEVRPDSIKDLISLLRDFDNIYRSKKIGAKEVMSKVDSILDEYSTKGEQD
jgi:hypothetical protein